VRRGLASFVVAVVLGCGAVRAAEDPPAKPPEKGAEAGEKEAPKPEQSITQHSVTIGGVPVAYTATAGTLIVRNEEDAPWASMGYIAYVRRDSAAGPRRPVTFAYNGGPGSSSIWLHMGALGPRRVVTTDAAPTPPPPYPVVDNAYSLLDETDLVLIDPVGTGLSKAVGEFKDKDFWAADPDIESVSREVSLFKYTWTNPSPEKTIDKIDFVSAMTNAAPFLVAITCEPLPGSGEER
jgi:carboxypeptidase C (cathepsin A)